MNNIIENSLSFTLFMNDNKNIELLKNLEENNKC